jgi:hypothetical protein
MARGGKKIASSVEGAVDASKDLGKGLNSSKNAKNFLIGAGGLGATAGLIAVSVLSTVQNITGAALGAKALDDVLAFLSDPMTLLVVGGVVVVVVVGPGMGSSSKS